jgi:hypothetical protein
MGKPAGQRPRAAGNRGTQQVLRSGPKHKGTQQVLRNDRCVGDDPDMDELPAEIAGLDLAGLLRVVGELEADRVLLARMQSLAVEAARSQGATWDAVASAVGVTRQGASQRFGR